MELSKTLSKRDLWPSVVRSSFVTPVFDAVTLNSAGKLLTMNVFRSAIKSHGRPNTAIQTGSSSRRHRVDDGSTSKSSIRFPDVLLDFRAPAAFRTACNKHRKPTAGVGQRLQQRASGSNAANHLVRSSHRRSMRIYKMYVGSCMTSAIEHIIRNFPNVPILGHDLTFDLDPPVTDERQ